MVYTIIDAKESFNHILDKLLGWLDSSPLKLALEVFIMSLRQLYPYYDRD
jgi:hypothetical protein